MHRDHKKMYGFCPSLFQIKATHIDI